MVSKDERVKERTHRQRLIARREAMSAGECAGWNREITEHLSTCLAGLARGVTGFCWPYRNEPDPRFAIHQLRKAGGRVALPQVVGKGHPLVFREWWPGAPMADEVFGIPVPVDTPQLEPDLAIVPVVAFDSSGYRLGYGGGYFDRTLAALKPQPIAVGVAYEAFRIDTIDPDPYDIPMDFVVTEAGVHARVGDALELVNRVEAAELLGALMTRRKLPRRQHD